MRINTQTVYLKRVISVCLFVAASVSLAIAQSTQEIPVLNGEKWWGGFTAKGAQMPLSAPVEGLQRLSSQSVNNQTVPFFVSNYGRYLWSDGGFDYRFEGNRFVFENSTHPVEVTQAGKTLREAYLRAAAAHFPASGTMPPELFFTVPQYNTWIELLYNQNQRDIEKYASDILSNGFPAGILMIDDNWQRYYGNFDFKSERFPDPKGMMDRLHAQGFKVMLWISPFVSPDTPEFREWEGKGYLIREKGSRGAAVIRWWNGWSACFDLTNPEAFDFLVDLLKTKMEEYGFDGYKFDAGDQNFYDPERHDFFDKNARAVDQTEKWAEVGLHFPYNEYRAAWKQQGKPLVQRLGDKNYSWGDLQILVPEMIQAGLMGYAFTCPDMIGGGQFGSFIGVDQTQLDQALIVRSSQVHALMPMMQFSVAPWRVLDKEHLGYALEAAKLHEKMAPYIIELAKEAAQSGEPIVRHMEYVFPNQGFSDCKDQYMLGRKYLVAPVMNKEGKRTVRLPKGVWTDDLGQRFRGPLVLEVTAPMDRIPYYELRR